MSEPSALAELRETARAFAAGCALGAEARDLAGEDAAAAEALAQLAPSGLLAWVVPAAHGGARAPEPSAPERLSVRALAVVRRELAYRSAMLDVAFVEQGLGSFPIALGGRDALRGEVLPEVLSGTRVAAFALTEEGAGSDLSRIALEARETRKGWTLDGHKTFVTNAGIADFYSVLARTSGALGESEGLSMLYVPAGAPGLSVERFEVTAPHPIGRLAFDGVEVPREHLLGAEGAGLDVAAATLETFRATVGAAATGFAARALDESVRHLTRREQFGRALSSFQGLRFDLAEMDARLRAAELLVEEAARAVDAGLPSRAAIARAKLFATEAASWICDRAVQHHGGLGVRRGSVVESLWRDVRALRIYEGTSEVQKLILAKEVLAARRAEP